MKKGFTLVEVAIVLVIIGLIIGMAIKGKQLIQVARTQRDISKIVALQTAVVTHEAKTGKIPSLLAGTNYPVLDIPEFTLSDRKLLSESVPSTFGSDLYFAPTLGKYQLQAGQSFYAFSRIINPINKNDRALLILSHTPDYVDANSARIAFPKRLICHIENTLDDRNYWSGDGTKVGDNPISAINLDLDDCYKYTKPTDYLFYGYSLHKFK